MRLIARLLGRAAGPRPGAGGAETPGSAPAALDDDLRDLLRRHISSPVKMDLVAYLHDNPFSLDPVRVLATRLGRDASLLEACAQDLARDGLLVVASGSRPGSEPLLQLSESPALRERLGRLVFLYRQGDPDGVRAAIRDCSIADAVRSALMGSARISARDIALHCTDGQVLLEGQVHTADERGELDRLCERLSQSRYGIRTIINRVMVAPRPSPHDPETAARIRRALGEGLSLVSGEPSRGLGARRLHIDVEVIGGIAYLSGLVESAHDRSRAAQITQDVAGVADVVNWLAVCVEHGRERRGLA